MGKKQYERYANAMMFWGLGYGLYEPPSDADAHPGACGYIDDSGAWQKLVNVSDDAALARLNLSKLDYPQQLKPVSTDDWGPKFTNTVKEKDIITEANLSLESLGVPANCSAVFRYNLKSDFGAVLLCHDAVELKGYPHKEPFRQWARANAKALQQHFRDIGQNGGFYVMTTTRSARDIYINAWTNKENTITIGMSVAVAEQAGATQRNSYYRGSAGSGWHHPHVTENERKVLFFSGVYLSFNKLTRHFSEQGQDKWTGYRAGGKEGSFLVEDGDDAYEVTMSIIKGDTD